MKLFKNTPMTPEEFSLDNRRIRKAVSGRRRSCISLYTLRPDTSMKRRRESRLLSNNIDNNKYLLKKINGGNHVNRIKN